MQSEGAGFIKTATPDTTKQNRNRNNKNMKVTMAEKCC